MAKNETYKKVLDENGQPLIIDGDFVMELVSSVEVEDTRTIIEIKNDLIAKVDLKTSANISQGFEYDGYTFSMSANAQRNWTNIINISESLFPLPVSTKFDEVYMLELNKRREFYDTVVNFTFAKLQEGVVKKQEIISANTKEELYLLEETI